MRLGLSIVAAAGMMMAAPVSAAAAPPPSLVESSRYLTGFDGTRLAVTVFEPRPGGNAAAARLPVIVTQDRGQESSPRVAASRQFFLNRGYVIVAQDRRGTGASFGVQKGFVNAFDAQDAKTVIEWAGAQPFSNGRVVTMGCSNQGAWQYLVSTLKPRHLVAIAPACASPQFFDHGVITNGVPMFPAGLAPFDNQCRPLAKPPASDRPVRAVDEDADGSLLRQAQAQRGCNAPMLGQYWRSMSRDALSPVAGNRPGLDDSAITQWAAVRDSGIPMLQIGGWFDAAVLGQLQGQNLWGGRVIMGPWVHGNTIPQGAAYPAGTLDLLEETGRWFDHYAKGVNNGADKPGVRFYTINAAPGREWRTLPSWPGVNDAHTPYFLTARGLSRQAGPGSAPATYRQQAVRWFEGRYEALTRWWGGDMAPTDRLMLGHDSAPLATATQVTGTPTLRLWLSADVPDANLFAVLEDVAPDGRSTYVSDGKLRLSWRKIIAAPFPASIQYWKPGYAADLQPLRPGEVVEARFEFFPVSYVFRPGHRIRLGLTTSIGKDYQVPPLAGSAVPTITVLRDAAHPSRLELPLVASR